MSALRIARPGEPVVLIDLGPSTARRTIGRYSTLGGSLAATPRVDLRRLFPATTPARREQIAAYRARMRATCQQPMRDGSCGRRDGHRDAHRTATYMEAQALSRQRA